MQRLNKQKKRGEDKEEELKQTKKEGVLKGRMIKFFFFILAKIEDLICYVQIRHI